MTDETVASFSGDKLTQECRVCKGALADRSVSAGQPPFETTWVQCVDCGSWSVDHIPDPDRLNDFYTHYATYHKQAATNPDANDGRRYTPSWRETREREYRLGVDDCGLELKPGADVVDFGAYDGLFLDVCRSLQPHLGKTTVVDYPHEDTAHLFAQGHGFTSIDTWLGGEEAVDVVTLWDVYEHVAALHDLMAALARRVKPGGQVVVQTPRAHLHAQILGNRWHHFLPVQHLQLPSRDGLLRQFDAYGFTAAQACSFGANAPGSIIPQPYKQLFDALVKEGDLGSTQIVRFLRR